MPLTHILKNKLLLQKEFNTQERSMDKWAYWMFEENIKISNSIIEETKETNKGGEESPTNNADSVIKNAQKAMSNIKMPNFNSLK